ncbi:competence type IV pilus ATPase ComGA [Evansella tamaricis]|uniref:GspE/PulE family protein n=1 Tax=Evansella tamaricis TaxID=2069301 RepID=A0ABS6JEY2_9BACI|nr:competence type IV pilus ATPase ComGA [Evansella tamaricis]MBU9712240.1 GspE/PulE family protein [Evansella tamaricis]
MEVERKMKDILLRAVAFRASDIHFVPMEKMASIRFRIDGQLVEIETLPVLTMTKIIGHLKFISGMDVGERRRPQNSALEIPLTTRRYSIRLSTFPSSFHETLVIRLFPHDNHQTIQHLSLFPSQSRLLLQLTQQSHGLVIICGPTGSGKTSTIYSLLHNSFHKMKRNIITLEDPIEQKYDEFLQMEINERAGITYATGLKSLLRHDPDLIMIGEIRDKETAEMAVRTAMTGHLVLSTLHCNSTINAVRRLQELGINPADIKETVRGIVAQQLVDIVCPHCGSACEPNCRKQRSRRRGAIYEILTGDKLDAVTSSLSKGEVPAVNIITLSKMILKGIALGYLSEEEFRKIGGKGGIEWSGKKSF